MASASLRRLSQDDAQAFRHYKLSFEKGAGPVAAYNLGRCYYFGRGVDKDLETAQELFKEAEEGGFPVWEKLNEK